MCLVCSQSLSFQCLSSAFCTFSWPCQQKCVFGKFCWNKKISYLFLAKKWVTWQNHWQAHTNREKALEKALGTDTAHGNSKNSSWNCSSSGLLSWGLLSSLATCRCERVVEHRRLEHRVLRMKMLDLILTSQKYANVTALDSRWTKYSNPCINNCRQLTPKGNVEHNLIEFVFPGFDLFRPFRNILARL